MDEETLFFPLAAQRRCRVCDGQTGGRLRFLCPGELSLPSVTRARQRREGTRGTDRKEGVIRPEPDSERRHWDTDGANAEADRQRPAIS